jgi:hypothetical protein
MKEGSGREMREEEGTREGWEERAKWSGERAKVSRLTLLEGRGMGKG